MNPLRQKILPRFSVIRINSRYCLLASVHLIIASFRGYHTGLLRLYDLALHLITIFLVFYPLSLLTIICHIAHILITLFITRLKSTTPILILLLYFLYIIPPLSSTCLFFGGSLRFTYLGFGF